MLAGWEPSKTWWLSDVLHAGEPHTWTCTRQADGITLTPRENM